MSSALVRALLDELDDEALDLLAERLRPRLEAQTGVQTAANGRSQWLNVKQAAEFLACPKSRVYDLVSLAKLQPRRDGTRLLFKRSDLDAYLERSC